MRKIILPEQTYFITTNIHDRSWIFVDRQTLQPIENHCDILIRNLEYYRKKFAFLLHGYVFMPDHVHLMISVGKKGAVLDVMRDWKHRTSFEMNRHMKSRGRLWQHDFWAHAITNERDLANKMEYIHNNPVVAGLVNDLADWKYSSARWYIDGTGSILINEP